MSLWFRAKFALPEDRSPVSSTTLSAQLVSRGNSSARGSNASGLRSPQHCFQKFTDTHSGALNLNMSIIKINTF